MTQPEPEVAPVLSSEPDYAPAATPITPTIPLTNLSEVYETLRTIHYIVSNSYRRIALQFPDSLLPASTRVVDLLKAGINNPDVKLYILADTSYGSCCVDEIAAEHCEADCVIHYGRACLSPTSRLPVLHVFTTMELDLEATVKTFKETFKDVEERIVVMSSLPYITLLPGLVERLKEEGYMHAFKTEVKHDPSSPIPNRTVPEGDLNDYTLFHIDTPLSSLVLTLGSRLARIVVYEPSTGKAEELRSTPLLRRRYALLSHIRAAGIVGILVNTLSAKNYLPVIQELKELLKRNGKKSYMFVVGKVNAAKVANFAEVECWVVVGCWESSVLDEGRDFWRPCVTPWEVRVALGGEGVGVAGWRTDFEGFLEGKVEEVSAGVDDVVCVEEEEDVVQQDDGDDQYAISDEESAPPTFDLRTGKYISSSTPLHITSNSAASLRFTPKSSTALTKTSKEKSVTMIGQSISPAAAYLKDKRVWTGLGSDYHEVTLAGGAQIEEGRAGVARGYRLGESGKS